MFFILRRACVFLIDRSERLSRWQGYEDLAVSVDSPAGGIGFIIATF